MHLCVNYYYIDKSIHLIFIFFLGRWVSGKMEGGGRLEWSDGKVYTGQFHCNLPHGIGRLETPSVSVYEGQWKDGLQNGYGCTK